MEQNQVWTAVEQSIRRKVHLFGRRQVDELGTRLWRYAPMVTSVQPLLGTAHVHQRSDRRRHTVSLPDPQVKNS
ncbi:hypothetical protein DSM43518_04516 [Mycobacterium marinum]|nr:hypothetical protein MM1218R_02019 [Mycobacterium marinum]AXN49332.1 hypothetical protein CCUG20998_01920 [Mycobacterium marinum]RFZ03801.1 hypothetical protein DSM43518_04516 [Mycobacterium marinum]RFZ04449.1 hypothetical protein VIMS_05143 [Mycobacterium marinum]RFZ16890.1 hypothetical protein DSM43519_04740 [Mycobacterium marinum]